MKNRGSSPLCLAGGSFRRRLACTAAAGWLLAGSLFAQTQWGNPFIYNTLGSQAFTIDSATKMTGTRFTATEDMTVDQFGVSIGTVTGSPNVVVELRADDGSGNPGALLASSLSGTLTSGAQYVGSLDASVSLVKGTTYHIVTRVPNADASNKVAVNFGTGSDTRYSVGTGEPDPSQNRLTTLNGTTWTATNSNQASGGISQVFVRNSATGAAMGQPIATLLLTTASGVGGTATRGEQFVYEGPASQALSSISLRLKKGSGNAADDLTVLLLDSTNNVLASQSLFAGGTFTDTGFNIHTLQLTTPVALSVGETYRLVLSSAGSTTDSYEAYFPGTLLTSSIDARGATFQGTQGFAISGTGLTGFTPNTAFDMYFSLGLVAAVPEPSPASLVGLVLLGGLALRKYRH